MPYKNPDDHNANQRKRYHERQDAWRKVKGHGVSADVMPVGTVSPLRIRGPREGLRIAVITDVQAMPGVPLDHLTWCGKYLAAKQPDVIVCIGDFGDFPTLSRFGSLKDFEGRRYVNDLAAFHQAMENLMNPIAAVADYKPYLEYNLGNHEHHIERFVDDNPKIEGLVSLDQLKLPSYGWRVHPFLMPISIGGVAFCHYFPSGVLGKPITSAPALLRKLHMSAFAGHQQGREIAYSRRADGSHMTAIISGSFYQHSYKYLSPFTNAHWRGFFMLHEVRDGKFDEMAVSINFLKRRFK